MTTIPQRVAFLKKIHLFRTLSEADLTTLAEALSDRPVTKEEVILRQGTPGEAIFLIYSGTFKVYQINRKGQENILAYLTDRDFFGEEEFLSRRPCVASVSALTDGHVLVLRYDQLTTLLKRFKTLRTSLQIDVNSRRLWRRLHFPWVRPDEVVYFMARKHPIVLWRSLVLPIFSFLAPAFFLVWGVFTGAIWPFAMAVVLILAIIGWIIWEIIDWKNDYYMVTNQRVVWVEKVIGLFDSRHEAPLHTILSVDLATDPIGNIFDYGTVIVRTFVGKIPFEFVSHPAQAARTVEEYWTRAKDQVLSQEKDALKNAIRKRLGLPIPEPPPSPIPPPSPPARKPSLIGLALSSLFATRTEEGDKIIYHKHPYVLLRKVWVPTLILLLLSGGWLVRLVTLAIDPAPEVYVIARQEGRWVADTLVLTLPMLAIPFALWWGYQYWDWKNDIFMVTSDQVIDIDRKPLGTEQKRSAPLENILSTESARIGLAGNLLNFGTVYISVGGSKMEFQDVADPATVQSDIDRRRMARAAAKTAAQVAQERERIAEWFAIYHLSAEQFREEQRKRDQTASGSS